MHIYDTKILHELHTWSYTNFICGHIQYKQLCMWVYMKFEFHIYASVQLPCIKIIEFHIWTYVKVSYVFTYATKKDLEIFFSKSLSWREDTYLWFDRLEKINPYINLWVPHRPCSQCVPNVCTFTSALLICLHVKYICLIRHSCKTSVKPSAL